jgi:Fic family protein
MAKNNILIDQILSKFEKLTQNKNWETVLYPWLRVELTYTSNSLEGNTLSLVETRIVIEDHQGIGGKSLREIYEAQNHAKAWDFIQSNLVKKSKISELDILKVHQLILNNIDDVNAGRYRVVPVRISGSMTILPNYLKVPELMAKLFISLDKNKIKPSQKVIDLAILAHLTLVKIHPFVDGNGRVARLLMNTILMQNNLPPVNITPTQRNSYLQSLEDSTIDNHQPFTDFILNSYNLSLDTYLETF